ncbi:uncharacterized protein LOC133192753 [Saccostrea echinata]|uniref:uncharacterized protein LOC133192753 n=1 Tax=Saccostrea echinata TaxID=191078 RepID=UPI002A7ED296|nr:uncharacterized protein LOC133192753 [Saccostrea echinata]
MKKANNESSLTNNRKKDTETSKYPQKHLPTVPFRDYPKTATDVDGRMTRRKSESFMDNAGKKKPEIIDKSPREQPRVQSAGLNLYDDVPNEKSDEKKTVTVSTVDERMTRSKGQSSIDNAGQEKLETTVKSPREQLGVQLAELHLYDDVPTENTNEKKTVTLINVEERMTRTRSESSMDNAGKKKLGKTDKIPRERTRVQSAELYLYDDVPNENKTVTETTDDQRNSNTTVGSSEHILKRSNETTKQERCRAAKYESYKEAADLYVERL